MNRMTSALSGLAMLLSACGGTQVRSDVTPETEWHGGFIIEYSSQGVTIEGDDRHGHEVRYAWNPHNGSSILHLVSDDSAITIRDIDGDGVADSYLSQDTYFNLQQQCIEPFSREQIRSVFVQHVCDLPVSYARAQWRAR